eukprot:TRINITY_DN4683_c0_g1_i2.p1 TRINITY_DN4683_c0_g1~~TRINITY_DN4683_c0_g1_i2.p1  ORF type:complete len:416 (-),score=71.55 TRINITY_DN4683_c0_g1_i2:414-1661(-)
MSLVTRERSFLLTELEMKIFTFLLEVQRKLCPTAVLRVAGGWVRDKLLGEASQDIDIALNVTGASFAHHVNDYLVETGHERRHVGVIKANPEAGKNLEIATMKVFDTFVDFVNLRSSNSNGSFQNSVIGTPEEDAMQRDLTINSLFYNINTNIVEDYSGRGFSDLEKHLIKTPKSALETFRDDPCRILRSFRFASRFSFQVSEEILDAVRSSGATLLQRCVRERIGSELEDILKGPSPEIALNLITSLHLTDVVFKLPPSSGFSVTPDLEMQCHLGFTNMLTLHETFSHWLVVSKSLLLLSALLMPFSTITYLSKKKQLPILFYVLTESLKMTRISTDTVLLFTNNCKEWQPVLEKAQKSNFSVDRVEVGLILKIFKGNWIDSLVLSSLSVFPKNTCVASIKGCFFMSQLFLEDY